MTAADTDVLTMCATQRALTEPARQLLRDRHHLTDDQLAELERLLPTWSFLGLAHSLAALIETARALA